MNRNLMAVEVAGMQGVGLTKTEAKANAMARLTEAMQGSYAPRMLSFPCQITAVIYRTPTSYGYILTSTEPMHRMRMHETDCVSAEHAEKACRVQAAQWLEGRVEDDGMSVIHDERDQSSHARYIGFQRAYRFYQAQGMSDQACHWHACQHALEFVPMAEPRVF